MHELRYYLLMAEGRWRVGDFLRLGNDAIQPLEKSASKLLICYKPNFLACGLQDFDAGESGRRRARREWNGALNRPPGRVVKSAGSRRNPHKHAGSRNEKGQPRAVDLRKLVEAARIEHASAARPPHSPHMLIPVFAFDRLLTGSLRISKIQQLRTTRVLHISLTLLVPGNSTSRISILTAPGQAVLRSSSCAVSG